MSAGFGSETIEEQRDRLKAQTRAEWEGARAAIEDQLVPLYNTPPTDEEADEEDERLGDAPRYLAGLGVNDEPDESEPEEIDMATGGRYRQRNPGRSEKCRPKVPRGAAKRSATSRSSKKTSGAPRGRKRKTAVEDEDGGAG